MPLLCACVSDGQECVYLAEAGARIGAGVLRSAVSFGWRASVRFIGREDRLRQVVGLC